MHEVLPLDMTARMALIAIAGIGAQWLGWRLRWPAIVLMALAGLLLGPLSGLVLDQPLIDPARDFGPLLRPAIALAVAVILFEGGLGLQFNELRDASKAVTHLVFIGAPLGWLLGAGAAHYVAGLPWDLAALIGGLLVVTGPTVIIPLLRQARLSARPAAVLKWEGIVNDPLGAVFAVLIFEFVTVSGTGEPLWQVGLWLLGMAVLGGLAGFVGGQGLAMAFRRGLVPEYLKAPLILVAVLGVYALAEALASETGLVAVTALGVTLGNMRFAAIEELRRFKEGIATILVSGLFVTLTAGLGSADILALNWQIGAFVLVMMVVVRPAIVWISTLGTQLTWREKLLIGWIAPRGIVAVAVAGFFATELAAQGRMDAAILTPLAFTMVFATVIVHGFSIAPLAKALGLSRANGPQGLLLVGANPWSVALAQELRDADIPLILADPSWSSLREARLAGIRVFHGEVLSETAEEKLDHAQIDWLLAASANDAYNALVCVEFAPELSRHRVYQLSGQEKNQSDSNTIAFTARGRIAINPGRTYGSLRRDFWHGWTFRKTTLSADYPLERFMADLPQNADLILARNAAGELSILSDAKPPQDQEGTLIISFCPPDPRPGQQA